MIGNMWIDENGNDIYSCPNPQNAVAVTVSGQNVWACQDKVDLHPLNPTKDYYDYPLLINNPNPESSGNMVNVLPATDYWALVLSVMLILGYFYFTNKR